MILYLSHWFPRKYLGRSFHDSNGACQRYWRPHLRRTSREIHGIGGLSGWQWLFLLEGFWV
ncbi:MAG: hypothetical protein RBT06_09755 [Smithellaceae bacterium]|nr:hypothetical protein [Smithellaceae bacterium]